MSVFTINGKSYSLQLLKLPEKNFSCQSKNLPASWLQNKAKLIACLSSDISPNLFSLRLGTKRGSKAF